MVRIKMTDFFILTILLESVCGFSFCRFPGSFEPIFDSFFGGNINFVYNPPKKESKSGQNNPGNRRNLNSQTDS